MKSRFFFLIVSVLLGTVSFETRAASFKLEPTSEIPAEASAGIKALLQPQGYRILNDQGAPWCEVWIRKEIATSGKSGSGEAKYPDLHVGQLVGLMKFSSPAADYRGQSIKPGIYTLRYCLILQDGNHLGVAPIPDFVLLIPASEDSSEPDAVMNTPEVVAMSRKTTGTNHPAVINLAPPGTGEPGLEKDDLDHWVLKAKTQSTAKADLPISIVVFGKTEG